MYVKHVPLGSDHSELHRVTGRVNYGRITLTLADSEDENAVVEAIDQATESILSFDGFELRTNRIGNPEDRIGLKWANFATPSSDGEKLLVTDGRLFIMGEDGNTIDTV